MKLDPGKNDASLVQVGKGQGDEYAEDRESRKSGGREKVEDVKARIADMSDEELDALASDERKGVQDALAAERERRAAAAESGGSSE